MTEHDDAACPVRPGEVLQEKYEVERVIGAGGMGVVVLARHVVLGQRVALKFLRGTGAAKPEVVTRFFREAQAAARVQGDHVARVYDVGRLPSGVPFLVMEYLVGRDLGEVLRTEGALPVDRAVTYVLQACEAIAHAHALGIVHRDLKPGNLFLVRTLDGEPNIKVLDFGISKSLEPDPTRDSLTRSQGVMGSPLYMSPEQVRSSKRVDGRSDIWSLGVMLHELLCARTPFEGPAASALFASIAADAPLPVRESAPHVPEGLAQVILRCLEKDPDARYASVAELAEALTPFARERDRGTVGRIAVVLGEAGATTVDSAAVLASSGPAASQPLTWGHTGKQQVRPSGARWRTMAAVVVATAVVLTVAVSRSRDVAIPPANAGPALASSDSPTASTRLASPASSSADAATSAGPAPLPAASVAFVATPVAAPARRPRVTATATATPPTRTEF